MLSRALAVVAILSPLALGCDAGPRRRPALGPPGAAEAMGPPGTVRIRFRSAEVDRRWQVFAYETPLCVTPCDRWMDPSTAFTMRSESGFRTKNSVNVPDLPPGAAGGPPLLVRAYPASFTLDGLGVTVTTLGALGAAAGIALAAVGCDTHDNTMCVGGAITIPASLAVMVPGIYMMARSAARAEVVGPGGEDMEGASWGPFKNVTAGPGFVKGAF